MHCTKKSKAVTSQLGQFQIVTTQMVLVEFMNFMGGRGGQLRALALSVVKGIAERADVEIVPQSSDQFQSAVNFVLFSHGQDVERDGLC